MDAFLWGGLSPNPDIYLREQSGAEWGCDTEKVGSDSGGEGCSILYLEVTGGAVLIRKTQVEETHFQSTFRSRIASLQSATKKFLSNRRCLVTVFFLEFCPCQFRLLSVKIISEKTMKKFRRKLQAPQYLLRIRIVHIYSFCERWSWQTRNRVSYMLIFFGAIILGLYWGYGMIISFNLYTISSILYQSMINTSKFIIYLLSLAAPSGSKPQIISFHEGHIKIKSRSSGGFSSSPSIMPWH